MTENEIELLNIIRESDNPEKAVIGIFKILTYYLEHPEIHDKPQAEQMLILQSIV